MGVIIGSRRDQENLKEVLTAPLLTLEKPETIKSILSVIMTAICFVWLEPLMQQLTGPDSEIPMTTSDISWVVAWIEVGEVLSTVPAGLLADRYGRKPLLLSTGPMCLVGWVIVLTTRNFPVLFLVRMIQGVALAIVFTVGPIYVAEISEPRIRGELSGHIQTVWYVGHLYSYVVGPLFDYQNYAYLCAAVPVVFTILFAIMPESPHYYLMVGNSKKALTALQWLRDSEDVDDEFKMISQTVAEDMKQKGSWKDLVATKRDRKSFLIVQLVCATRYFGGMSAVTSYAAQTFTGASPFDPHTLTVSLGVLLCVTTTFSAFFSDSVGRRPLMLYSVLGSIIFNIVLGGYFYLNEATDVDVSGYYWVMFIALGGFAASANIGVGPLLQTIQAEYFPSHTRGIGGGVTEMTAAVTAFISLKQYQIVIDMFGIYMNYWIFAIFSTLGFLLLYWFLPETAGKSMGQIQNDMLKTGESNGDLNKAYEHDDIPS